MEPQQIKPQSQSPQPVAPPNPAPGHQLPSKKTAWLVLGLLIVLIVIGVVIWLGRRHKTTPKPSTATQSSSQADTASDYFEHRKYEATVWIQPTGMLPATLQVRPQTGVVFENHDTKPHQIAFTEATKTPKYYDNKHVILPGETVGARFDAPGTYTYADPTSPSLIGTVIVSDKLNQ